MASRVTVPLASSRLFRGVVQVGEHGLRFSLGLDEGAGDVRPPLAHEREVREHELLFPTLSLVWLVVRLHIHALGVLLLDRGLGNTLHGELVKHA